MLTKAHATIGHYLMQGAAFASYILVGILMAADQIRTSFGVDLVKHVVVAQAIVGAAYFIGKAIFENRGFMEFEPLPDAENPDPNTPDPV